MYWRLIEDSGYLRCMNINERWKEFEGYNIADKWSCILISIGLIINIIYIMESQTFSIEKLHKNYIKQLEDIILILVNSIKNYIQYGCIIFS